MESMLNWYRAYAQRPPQDPPSWRVTVPTMMIWGARDTALGQEMARPSIELCNEGELYILTKATHWVQHDESARVNELLETFLA
jgi:pimeloyl-ACP methyl ester carboxylesterase